MRQRFVRLLLPCVVLAAAALPAPGCKAIDDLQLPPGTGTALVTTAEQVAVQLLLSLAKEKGWTPAQTREAMQSIVVAMNEEAPVEVRSLTVQPVPLESTRAAVRSFYGVR